MKLNPDQFKDVDQGPVQLPMFLPAGYLRNAITYSLDAPGRPDDALWERKRKEDRELYESVQKEGVKRPVSVSFMIGGLNLWDGHHRVASARDDQEVPLSWSNRQF